MRECPTKLLRLLSLSILLTTGVLLSGCGWSTAKFLAKGEEYLAKRKFHDAMMQFRSAAESDPESAKAHWGLARAYENLGQFTEVLDELRKTVQLDDNNLEAKARLGNYFLLIQPPMISETEKLRDEILAKDPNFIEGHILTASIMAAQSKPDADVIAQVNKAIAMDPARIESYISLERMYTTRDRASDAEETLRRGLAVVPNSVAGRIEYGKFLTYADHDREAEAEFQKAIAADPASIEAHEAIADFYVTSVQSAKAEAAYKDLIAMQENSPESRLELASFYANADRKDEAIGVLSQIIADSPEYVRARYQVGQIFVERRELAKAYEQIDALLKVNDHDVEALQLRARAKMQENKDQEAVADLEEILKKQPSHRDALYLIAQAKLALGQLDVANAFIADIERFHPTFLKVGLLQIQSANTAGDTNAALKLSNELLDKTAHATPNADNPPEAIRDLKVKATTSRGLAYLDLGKLAEAKNDFNAVIVVTPRSSSAMVNLAKVAVAEKDLVTADGMYEKGLALDGQNFDAMNGIVSVAIQRNATAHAHSRIAEMIAANSGKADTAAALHYLNATVFTAEKNNPAAEQELLASIELDADYLPAYSAYATMLAGQNRGDEAIAQYKRVIERHSSAQVYTMLGILEDGRGNTGEAEANYRKALEIAPETPIAANNLAWLIVDNSGNLDEALQLATLAVGKNPSIAGFYDTLGYVYLKKGLTAPAVEQFKKAVAMDDTNVQKTGAAPNPAYRVRLAMALAKSGDKTSAKREVDASLKYSAVLTQREQSDARSVLNSL